MNSTSVRWWYLSGLFVLLTANVPSATLAALGIHGFAFYHVQAAVLLLCAAQFCVMVLRGSVARAIDPILFGILVFSLLYSATGAVFLLRFSDIVPEYVALIVHTVLFYPATALLMLGCSRPATTEDKPCIPAWILYASLAVVPFAWLQFIVGDPILKVTNSENVSKLVSANVLGTFRPPSVFESSFQFGLFSVLLFCLAAARALFGKGGKRAWMVAGLAMSGIGLSQTRNVFLCGVCCAISLLALLHRKRRGGKLRLLKLAPVAYVCGAVALMVYAIANFLRSDMAKTGDLADASSTWARVSSWQSAWQNLVLRGSALDALFGFGITQAGQSSDYRRLYPARADGLFIDSTFVNLFLLQGIVGLLLFLGIWWLIWKRLLRRTVETWDPLTAGITAFFSAFLAAGVFNILNGQWWGIALALSLTVLSCRTVGAQEKPHA